ncbi:MAG: shikimate dehydrogenase [Deltaproteobacteria bacterium]|nr:shikimate dehydrogenase [Deltaproteobacteria bacterium]MBW2361065.1 shikimate dehydrogenase [Deltaproteobacteria bacterium]
MTLCGIVLHPAGHTRSPAMHTAAYSALGLNARYEVFDVPPQELAAAIAQARARGVRQLAVSLPHKETVIPHLDRIDDTARAIGAVNTVTRRDGALEGSNTDWLGAVRALERETPLAGRHAVVLGAGGSARAVVYGLHRRGATVTVLNRSISRAETLARDLGARRAGPLAALADVPHDVLVNTTSVGLRSDASPIPADVIRPESVVMDAVYDPEITRLLRDAQLRGARTIPGKWMLVYQAAAQLELWSDREAPVAVMAEAFDDVGTRA